MAPMTPGYYMPTWMNNVSGYPNYYPAVPQQSYAPSPMQQNQDPQEMIWVDGEGAAKAFQMPRGWPVGKPIPLWDLNEPVIYFKSLNQAGMPNPLQKARYTMDEQQQQPMLPAGQTSGASNPQANFATKDDLASMKNELMEALKQNQYQNQNGSQNAQNRGNGK